MKKVKETKVKKTKLKEIKPAYKIEWGALGTKPEDERGLRRFMYTVFGQKKVREAWIKWLSNPTMMNLSDFAEILAQETEVITM